MASFSICSKFVSQSFGSVGLPGDVFINEHKLDLSPRCWARGRLTSSGVQCLFTSKIKNWFCKHKSGIGKNLSGPILRYRKYLKSYYENFPIVLDDKLSIAPCSRFIILALVRKEESPHVFMGSSTDIVSLTSK